MGSISNLDAALLAWQSLHKKPISSKRFVEVFALFPPHCPLHRRSSVIDNSTLSPMSAHGNNMRTFRAGSVPSNVLAETAAAGCTEVCPFCLSPFSCHADGGAAAKATATLIERQKTMHTLSLSLMHTGFLKVPALLYPDAGLVTRTEVDTFNPDAWQRSEFYKYS